MSNTFVVDGDFLDKLAQHDQLELLRLENNKIIITDKIIDIVLFIHILLSLSFYRKFVNYSRYILLNQLTIHHRYYNIYYKKMLHFYNIRI